MIPLVDLKAQIAPIRAELDLAIKAVIDNTSFILGPAVERFEHSFARYIGSKHCVAVNSGTAALHLALLGRGIGAGDEVITTSSTFFATAEAISLVGARPIFVDVEPDTLNIDPARIEAATTSRTRAIIPVHLFGQSANMGEIQQIARRKGLDVIEDACQAHGATYDGKRAGSLGLAGCFSFYPGKNLGAFGEGGAILTDDDALASKARQLREHGSAEKYRHNMVGLNYRLEGIQGAVLDVKLRYLDGWNEARRNLAERYRKLLSPIAQVTPLAERAYGVPVYHLFVVRSQERERIFKVFAEREIARAMHYPIPVHLQPAYACLGHRRGDFPISGARRGRDPVSAAVSGDDTLPAGPGGRRDSARRPRRAMTMALSGRSFLVTGGAGFIRSNVVDALVHRGASVRVLDDLSVGLERNVAGALKTGRATLAQVDVRNYDALREASRGADTVVHMAVQCLRVSLADPMLVHEVNATGTLNALRAAREAGVSRFVYVSSSEVYGSAAHDAPMREDHPLLPTTPYGASKAAGELYTDSFFRSYGLATTVVRPFNAFGPRSHASGPYGEVIPRFVARALRGEGPVVFGDGTQTRDFTYVEDTAAGIVAAACSGKTVGETINIARGREVAIVDVARAVARACGRPDLELLFEAARPADVHRHLADVRRAEDLLGYRARVDLEEGIRRYLMWVRETGLEVSAVDARARNW